MRQGFTIPGGREVSREVDTNEHCYAPTNALYYTQKLYRRKNR